MKRPKRLSAGQYEWDVFDITKVQCYDGDVFWTVGVREGFWLGDQGYFEAGYGIDSCDTYADARYIVECILNDPMFKVKKEYV